MVENVITEVSNPTISWSSSILAGYVHYPPRSRLPVVEQLGALLVRAATASEGAGSEQDQSCPDFSVTVQVLFRNERSHSSGQAAIGEAWGALR